MTVAVTALDDLKADMRKLARDSYTRGRVDALTAAAAGFRAAGNLDAAETIDAMLDVIGPHPIFAVPAGSEGTTP